MNTGKHGLTVEQAPQFFDRTSTAAIMWTVFLCLMPATIWGIYQYGLAAFAVLIAAIGSTVLTEWLISAILAARSGGRQTTTSGGTATTGGRATRSSLSDGSAVLSGLLIGLTLPPGVPLAIPIIAGVFAMAVVKWSFGGLGRNWMNPALGARAFVQFSFPKAMSTWMLPRTLHQGAPPDVVASATPLGAVAQHVSSGTASGGPVELLKSVGYPRTDIDMTVTQWLNTHILSHLGISLPAGYIDPFLGTTPGAIGEGSALLLLIGSVFMFGRRIISWEIPLSFFLSFGLLELVFGGLRFGAGPFSGDVLFEMLSGGALLAMFFMATDSVTTPMTGTGMILFGAGVGIVTWVVRTFGAMPEGVGMAIIFMNMFVPLINRATAPSRYGLSAARTRGGAA